MSSEGLDYLELFSKGPPSASHPWQGHPKYNFIGGHHDPDLQPMDAFIESAANVFKGDPRSLSMYGFMAPKGCCPCAAF